MWQKGILKNLINKMTTERAVRAKHLFTKGKGTAKSSALSFGGDKRIRKEQSDGIAIATATPSIASPLRRRSAFVPFSAQRKTLCTLFVCIGFLVWWR